MNRRLLTLVLAAALLSLAILAPAQGQEHTGTIAGRIYNVNQEDSVIITAVLVVPVDVPQPVPIDDLRELYWHDADDRQGNFTVSGLADGEYVVGFVNVNPDLAPTLQERLLVQEGGDTVAAYAALRVTIEAGGTVTLDVPLDLPEAPPPPTDGGSPGIWPDPYGWGTGTISGRLVIIGPPIGVGGVLWFLPPDTPQPFELPALDDYRLEPDDDGGFYIYGLPAGEYLLLIAEARPDLGTRASLDGVELPLETVSVTDGREQQVWLAIRVTVGEAEVVSGIEVVFTIPTVVLPSIGDDLTLPDTGSASGSDSGTAWYSVAAAASALAALLLAASVGLQVSRRRRSRR